MRADLWENMACCMKVAGGLVLRDVVTSHTYRRKLQTKTGKTPDTHKIEITFILKSICLPSIVKNSSHLSAIVKLEEISEACHTEATAFHPADCLSNIRSHFVSISYIESSIQLSTIHPMISNTLTTGELFPSTAACHLVLRLIPPVPIQTWQRWCSFEFSPPFVLLDETFWSNDDERLDKPLEPRIEHLQQQPSCFDWLYHDQSVHAC